MPELRQTCGGHHNVGGLRSSFIVCMDGYHNFTGFPEAFTAFIGFIDRLPTLSSWMAAGFGIRRC